MMASIPSWKKSRQWAALPMNLQRITTLQLGMTPSIQEARLYICKSKLTSWNYRVIFNQYMLYFQNFPVWNSITNGVSSDSGAFILIHISAKYAKANLCQSTNLLFSLHQHKGNCKNNWCKCCRSNRMPEWHKVKKINIIWSTVIIICVLWTGLFLWPGLFCATPIHSLQGHQPKIQSGRLM